MQFPPSQVHIGILVSRVVSRGTISVTSPQSMTDLAPLPCQDRLRVLIADSTSMSTQLLVEALARDPHFEVIESAPNGAAVLQLLKREDPQIALMSAALDGNHSRGYDLVREIRSQSPATRVIVLLDASEKTPVIESFRAGAQGVFCRTEPFRLLNRCIQCVHQGQIWASSSELQYVLEALARPAFPHLSTDRGSLLSARETDVVRCLVEGLTNREIARRLKLTEHTVKNYLFRIFDKLGVSSRVEVVLFALGAGVAQVSARPVAVNSQAVVMPRVSTMPIRVPVRKTAT
ncbi:MAG TPA: response regulator transcription factor [Candidatus Sulfotelmatobacter sp.]|nr:response regulator transcription factor [Candidatus Sulfotelmatobacter sp.]